MKNVFIIQNTSGYSKRILKRIGSEKDRNTLGFVVEIHEYSLRLSRFKKPKLKKFDFFIDALNFTYFRPKDEAI